MASLQELGFQLKKLVIDSNNPTYALMDADIVITLFGDENTRPELTIEQSGRVPTAGSQVKRDTPDFILTLGLGDSEPFITSMFAITDSVSKAAVVNQDLAKKWLDDFLNCQKEPDSLRELRSPSTVADPISPWL